MKKISLILLSILFVGSVLNASTTAEVNAFTDVLKNVCGIDNYSDYMNATDKNFDGNYTDSINCGSKGLTDDNLSTFKVLTQVNGSLYLNDNSDITTLTGLDNLKSVGSTLNLRNLKVTDLTGLGSLQTVGILYLYGMNDLTSLNGLDSIKNIKNRIYLMGRNSTSKIDFSALNNLDTLSSKIGIYFQSNLFYGKMPKTSAICSADTSKLQFYEYDDGSDGSSTTIDTSQNEIYKRYFCGIDNQDWVDFKNVIYNKCGEPAKYEKYIDTENGVINSSVNCDNKGLTNTDLATFKVLKKVNGSLYLNYNTDITSLNGLNNLENVGGTLGLRNSKITDLTGLGKLQSVGILYLYGTNDLISLNGLDSIKKISRIYLMGRSSTTKIDLSALNNLDPLSSKLLIFFYGKMPKTSAICSADTSKLQFYELDDGSDGTPTLIDTAQNEMYKRYFCGIDNQDWIDFKNVIYNKCGETPKYEKYINVDNGIIYSNINCGSKSLTNDDLATFKVLNAVTGFLRINDNADITTLNGLQNLESAYGILLYDDNENDLTGLNNLNSVNYLYLYGNNSLTSLKGLENLTTLRILKINNTPNLKDISALSNISNNNIIVYFNNNQNYTNKIKSYSSMCNISNYHTNYSFYYWDANNNYNYTNNDLTSNICNSQTEDNNNLKSFLTSKCNITGTDFDNNFDTSTRIYTGNLDCSNMGLTNADLVNFQLIKDINGSFNISNNNISNLSNIQNITIEGNYYINNNSITDLTSLENEVFSNDFTLQMDKKTYNPKLNINDEICNGSINVSVLDENGNNLDKYYICEGMPIPDGTPCDDGNPDTYNDTYQNGVCQPGLKNGDLCPDDGSKQIKYMKNGKCIIGVGSGFTIYSTTNETTLKTIKALRKKGIKGLGVKTLIRIKKDLEKTGFNKSLNNLENSDNTSFKNYINNTITQEKKELNNTSDNINN